MITQYKGTVLMSINLYLEVLHAQKNCTNKGYRPNHKDIHKMPSHCTGIYLFVFYLTMLTLATTNVASNVGMTVG
jgi:hypothetical protein